MNAPFSLFTRNETAHSLPMLHSNNLFALGREIRIMHAGEGLRELSPRRPGALRSAPARRAAPRRRASPPASRGRGGAGP